MLSDFFDADSLMVRGSVKNHNGVVLLQVGMGRGEHEDYAIISLDRNKVNHLLMELRDRIERDVDVKQNQEEEKTTNPALKGNDLIGDFKLYLDLSQKYIADYTLKVGGDRFIEDSERLNRVHKVLRDRLYG